MTDTILVGLASIVIIGVAAQWLAWALKVPSILLLLVAGIIVGPVLGWLDPDELFGDLLNPAVSLAVGIILFEGGLSLRFDELRGIGGVTWRLISIGTFTTWVILGLAAALLFEIPQPVGALLGAILVVSGPTVIVPLLRHIRPTRRLATILRWEGIVIDAVGSMFAVIVFQAILSGQEEPSIGLLMVNMVVFIVVGVLVGGIVAALVISMLRRFTIPDHLHSGVSMMMALVAFVAADLIQSEAGLLATIVLGVALANQPFVPVRSIVEFSETIRGLLIAVLFVVLAARLDTGAILGLGMQGVALLAITILVARPLATWFSTMASDLTWPERGFVAGVAPRGIVAASIASLFASELTEMDVPGVEVLEPAAFLIIIGTVVVYGFGAGPLARRLGVARPDPRTVLLIGGDRLARSIGLALADAGVQVHVVASNREEGYAARMGGLTTAYTTVLGEDLDETLVDDTGVALAVTRNDDYNSLACLRLGEHIGQSVVFQLQPASSSGDQGEVKTPRLRGRLLFDEDIDHASLTAMIENGHEWRVTPITAEFDLAGYHETHPEATPLLIIDRDGLVHPLTDDGYVGRQAAKGDRIMALVPVAVSETPDERS